MATAPTDYVDPTAPLGTSDHIVVYSTPGCTRCRQALRFFHRRGVPHVHIELEDYDPALRSRLMEVTGATQAPVFIIHDAQRSASFYGLRMNIIEELVREHASDQPEDRTFTEPDMTIQPARSVMHL